MFIVVVVIIVVVVVLQFSVRTTFHLPQFKQTQDAIVQLALQAHKLSLVPRLEVVEACFRLGASLVAGVFLSHVGCRPAPDSSCSAESLLLNIPGFQQPPCSAIFWNHAVVKLGQEKVQPGLSIEIHFLCRVENHALCPWATACILCRLASNWMCDIGDPASTF